MNSVAITVILGLLSSPLPFRYQDSRFVIAGAYWKKEATIIAFTPDMTLADALRDPEVHSLDHTTFANFVGALVIRDNKSVFVRTKDTKNPDIFHYKMQPYDIIYFGAPFF